MADAEHRGMDPVRLLAFLADGAKGADRPWQLQVAAHWQGDCLTLRYLLQGPLELLRLPPALAAPTRCDNLWQHTCLEAFVAIPGAAPYWEVNLSPSGAWNLYRLAGYRHELQPEPACRSLAISCRTEADAFTLEARVPLPRILQASHQLQLGLCAVLEDREGELSYWALHHPGSSADFHDRSGFRLLLERGDGQGVTSADPGAAPPPGR